MSSLMTASDGVYTPRMVKVQSPGEDGALQGDVLAQPPAEHVQQPDADRCAAERSWRKACFWSSGTTISGYIAR